MSSLHVRQGDKLCCVCVVWCLTYSAVNVWSHLFDIIFQTLTLRHMFTLRTFFDSPRAIMYGHALCFTQSKQKNTSRDKPNALINDYVTVERTGRGCRRYLGTLSCLLLSYWLLSVLIWRLHITPWRYSCIYKLGSAFLKMHGGSRNYALFWATVDDDFKMSAY